MAELVPRNTGSKPITDCDEEILRPDLEPGRVYVEKRPGRRPQFVRSREKHLPISSIVRAYNPFSRYNLLQREYETLPVLRDSITPVRVYQSSSPRINASRLDRHHSCSHGSSCTDCHPHTHYSKSSSYHAQHCQHHPGHSVQYHSTATGDPPYYTVPPSPFTVSARTAPARAPVRVHTCAACGKFRSSSYHSRNPIQKGEKPVQAYCKRCIKNVSTDEEGGRMSKSQKEKYITKGYRKAYSHGLHKKSKRPTKYSTEESSSDSWSPPRKHREYSRHSEKRRKHRSRRYRRDDDRESYYRRSPSPSHRSHCNHSRDSHCHHSSHSHCDHGHDGSSCQHSPERVPSPRHPGVRYIRAPPVVEPEPEIRRYYLPEVSPSRPPSYYDRHQPYHDEPYYSPPKRYIQREPAHTLDFEYEDEEYFRPVRRRRSEPLLVASPRSETESWSHLATAPSSRENLHRPILRRRISSTSHERPSYGDYVQRISKDSPERPSRRVRIVRMRDHVDSQPESSVKEVIEASPSRHVRFYDDSPTSSRYAYVRERSSSRSARLVETDDDQTVDGRLQSDCEKLDDSLSAEAWPTTRIRQDVTLPYPPAAPAAPSTTRKRRSPSPSVIYSVRETPPKRSGYRIVPARSSEEVVYRSPTQTRRYRDI